MMKLIPMTAANFWKPETETEKKTPYKIQRDVMNDFMKPLRLFLRGLCLNPRGTVHHKLVLKENMQRAFRDTYDREIDYSRIIVSKGKLPVPRYIAVKSSAPGRLLFTWNNNSGRRGAYRTDQLFVALFHLPSRKWIFQMNEALRSDCKMDMDVYGFEGQAIHIYAGFISAESVRISTSVYLGCKQIEKVVALKRACALLKF